MNTSPRRRVSSAHTFHCAACGARLQLRTAGEAQEAEATRKSAELAAAKRGWMPVTCLSEGPRASLVWGSAWTCDTCSTREGLVRTFAWRSVT